ncbi:MAG: L,D-transpeptidase family protein [Pseudomonadota bacterium]
MIRPDDLVVGPWGARFQARRFPCAHGRGGIRRVKREGDLASPEGTWRMLWLYWRADRGTMPATALPEQPLGPRQGWSEDPADPAYNRPVRHPHPYAVDRMRRGDPLYDIVAVTDQNFIPAFPHAGSAIFVHLWRKPRHPTAGCIAFRRRDLEWILARWNQHSRLIIRARGGLW